MEKCCPHCGETKSFKDFHNNRTRKDGKQFHCKTCVRVMWKAPSEAKRREYQATYRESHREELAAKRRAYYRRNPDKLKAAARQYALAHPEWRKAVLARMWERNPEAIRAAKRKWSAINKEAECEKQRRRRARLRACLHIPFSVAQLKQRLSMFGGHCWVCGEEAAAVDHVKPLVAGGPHILSNLRPICGVCNSRKGAQWPFISIGIR